MNNSINHKYCLVLLTVLLTVVAPAFAAEHFNDKINVTKLGQEQAGGGVSPAIPLAGEDRQLAIQKDGFLRFAVAKLQEMNSSHILSRARMKIEKGPDGLYRAFFHEIDHTSLTCQVNGSQTKSVPYVGVLSYKERVYASSCATPEECRRGQFTAVEEIPNRHIFILKNGSWQ